MILLLIIFTLVVSIYYFWFGVEGYLDIETKKEFIIHIIPFGGWVYKFKNYYKSLD